MEQKVEEVATTAIYTLFGQDKFKVKFENVPKGLVKMATDICTNNFIHVNKLIVSPAFLPPKKELDDFEFFFPMLSQPSAIIPVCKFFLALAYNKNNAFCRGDDKKYLIIKNAKVFKSMIQAAKCDNVYAQHILGYNYDIGESPVVRQDYAKAYQWYTKADKRGNPDATFRLGRFLFPGFGCNKNYSDSLTCFEGVHFFAEQYGEAPNYMGMTWENWDYMVLCKM